MSMRWGIVALGATVVALIVTGCSNSEPEGIPASWEHGNWTGGSGRHDWLVEEDQSIVSVLPGKVRDKFQETLLSGTEEERIELLEQYAAGKYRNATNAPPTVQIDLDVDGVAVRQTELGEGREADVLVYLQLTGSPVVWEIAAYPLRGDVDPYVLKHFVPEFDPAIFPEPVEFDRDGLFELMMEE